MKVVGRKKLNKLKPNCLMFQKAARAVTIAYTDAIKEHGVSD